MYNIALVDQHELFRHSFKCLIELHTDYKICINVNCLSQLNFELRPNFADILVVDIENITKNEWMMLCKTSKKYPELKIIVLSYEIVSYHIQKIIECGIKGYYSKNISHIELLAAIKEIINSNNSYELKLGSKVREKLSSNKNGHKVYFSNNDVKLSQRELQILDLVSLEYSNAQISELLKLSKRTIEVHRSRIIKKTGCKSMIGAVFYAAKRDLIKTQF